MSHEHHESHFGTYVTVFFVLCVFTALSWIADEMQMANRNLLRVIVLAIATAKALCVMAIFMHLKFERAWKYMLLAPTLILASAIPFALAPDVGMHYYTVDVPQVREFAKQRQVEAHGVSEAHHPEPTPEGGGPAPEQH